MSDFERLITCIRSGQMSDAQIAEELKDPVFRHYYRQQTQGRQK